MKLTLRTARDPKWANAERTAINLFVTFEENVAQYGEMEFSAASYDVEAHGRDIFQRAITGEFGPVADYVVTPERALLLVRARTTEASDKIGTLQSEIDVLQDATNLDMATDEELARLPRAASELTAWKRYRVLLSRVEAQAGFPDAIEWPEKPA